MVNQYLVKLDQRIVQSLGFIGAAHLPNGGSDRKLVRIDFVADLGNINGFIFLDNVAKAVIFNRYPGWPFTRCPWRIGILGCHWHLK